MRRAEIRHKCIMQGREAMRRHSEARTRGVSIFIKRCYRRYIIMAVRVTGKQRALRDLFGEAQRMAKEDLRSQERRELWEKYAEAHGIRGAHRGAVSYYYRLLREKMVDRHKRTDKVVKSKGIRPRDKVRFMDTVGPRVTQTLYHRGVCARDNLIRIRTDSIAHGIRDYKGYIAFRV